MSCKMALYGANTASQSIVAAGTVINFDAIVRRFGCGLGLSGGNVTIKGSGYYDLDVNLSILPTAAGVATIQIFKDGVAIPGAQAVVNLVASESAAVTIPAIIRELCDCEDTITVQVSGADGSVTNAAIVVEKI